jgi:hypothetical protein
MQEAVLPGPSLVKGKRLTKKDNFINSCEDVFSKLARLNFYFVAEVLDLGGYTQANSKIGRHDA